MKFYLFSAKKSLFLEKLQNALVEYKKIFDERWQGEKYKWEAVKWFQDHWDINANDFADMFAKATEKTANLLASMNNFPRKMVIQYRSGTGNVSQSL